MKLSTVIFAAVAIAASVHSSPLTRRDVDPALALEFGISAGVNPDGTGNCDGIPGPTGKPILIPCACPPPRGQFISALNANVAAGHMVNNTPILAPFPTGNSKAEQQARITTLLSTLALQNLRGPGVGCPAVSTVYGQKQQEIINALPN